MFFSLFSIPFNCLLSSPLFPFLLYLIIYFPLSHCFFLFPFFSTFVLYQHPLPLLPHLLPLHLAHQTLGAKGDSRPQALSVSLVLSLILSVSGDNPLPHSHPSLSTPLLFLPYVSRGCQPPAATPIRPADHQATPRHRH